MHGAGGKMNQRARRCRCRLGTDAKSDLALDDEEGLVPGMTVRRRSAAFGPTLEENLIAFGRFARCEHGDVFADDVERGRVIPWRNDKRFCGHLCFLLLGASPAGKKSTFVPYRISNLVPFEAMWAAPHPRD